MTAAELQVLAQKRAEESAVLLKGGHYDGAYYLAGYAVECAIKACIAKQFIQGNIPKKEDVNKVYTHDLANLLKQAAIDQKAIAGTAVEINWVVVKDWTVDSRYESGTSRKEVEDMYGAITDPKDGVLAWIKNYW